MEKDNKRQDLEKHFPLALVTGAAHRLGRSFAECLARQGFAIALHYFKSGAIVANVVNEIRKYGVPVFPIQADLCDQNAIRDLFIEIDSLVNNPKLGIDPMRVLVNSAAVMVKSDVKTLKVEEFDTVMALNFRAPFFCSQEAFSRMTKGGVIVNISDIAAEKTWKDYAVYTASKAGLDTMTRMLAKSFAPTVRVNGIAPGLVLAAAEITATEWSRLISRLPLNREASLEELCNALEFLIKNEYITGQIIKVDGGYSLI